MEAYTSRTRERGNALVFCILVLTLLMGLSLASMVVAQKNTQQARFLSTHTELVQYAQSGLAMAYHELQHNSTKERKGMIGCTEWWDDEHDVGRDGIAGTGDDGEGDGLPTVGEPQLLPVPVGPDGFDGQLITYVADTEWSLVKRIVSTAYNDESEVTTELYVVSEPVQLPGYAAIMTNRLGALSFERKKSQAFVIDGYDTNPDGTVGPESAVDAIAIVEGEMGGENRDALEAQIHRSLFDQFVGSTSVGEFADFGMDSVYDRMRAKASTILESGTYANDRFGNPASDSYQVTYIDGDAMLSGRNAGAGVLVIGGDLTVVGEARFEGLVVVKGNITFEGGGGGIHVFGSVMTLGGDIKIVGNVDIKYSSQALANVEAFVASGGGDYQPVFMK